MESAPLFMPAQPPRVADWQPYWRFLYGERLRNAVWGTAEPAYDAAHRRYKFINRCSASFSMRPCGSIRRSC